jgi:hypothetical protein
MIKVNPCYFCQSPIPSRDMDGHYHYLHFYCLNCAINNQLEAVITTQDTVDNSFSAYIYDTKWRVSLLLKQNKTNVKIRYSFETILEVPGFPITPNNFQDKLKLYLTFS